MADNHSHNPQQLQQICPMTPCVLDSLLHNIPCSQVCFSYSCQIIKLCPIFPLFSFTTSSVYSDHIFNPFSNLIFFYIPNVSLAAELTMYLIFHNFLKCSCFYLSYLVFTFSVLGNCCMLLSSSSCMYRWCIPLHPISIWDFLHVVYSLTLEATK